MMATISNRSRYFVSVAKRHDLYKVLPVSAQARANGYLELLDRVPRRGVRVVSPGLAGLVLS